MTPVERYAELVHAESPYQKVRRLTRLRVLCRVRVFEGSLMLQQSLLGIVYSDDWLAFIQEVYVLRSLFLSPR
jgi:hypothetical protein